MNKYASIQQLFDDNGLIERWPSRKKKNNQLLVLEYLFEKFDTEKKYTEKEVNELLNQYHSFGDPAMLRRELFEKKMLRRTLDGRAYWVNKEILQNS